MQQFLIMSINVLMLLFQGGLFLISLFTLIVILIDAYFSLGISIATVILSCPPQIFALSTKK